MHEWMQAAAQAAAPQTTRPVPAVVPGRVLHMDGDLLAYWAGGSEDTTVAESRSRALSKIEAMRDYSGSESVVLHLTAEASTKGDRFIIATVKPYQGQRKASRKPKNWAYLRDFLTGYGGTVFRPKEWATREADDGIALCAYDAHRKGLPPAAIASADKDMRMLPGVHVAWDNFALTEVPLNAFDVVGADGKQYGHKWFWLQMLQGDTADNIPGLEKYVTFDGKVKPVGEKLAATLLEPACDNGSAYSIVLGAYASYYGTLAKARMVEQAMLLWLRTDMPAKIGDFLKVCPADPALEAHVADVATRIMETYAEAECIKAGVTP